MNKEVNISTLVIDGVDTRDYPDFCDAYVAYGNFADGTEMSESDLDTFNEDNPEVAQEMAFESLVN